MLEPQIAKVEEEDIQIGDLLAVFWSYKKLIISITGLFSIVSLIWALSLPNIYQSVSMLEAKLDYDSKGSSGGSSLSAFSELAGVSIGGSGGEMANLATATLTSRDFLKHLIQIDDLFLPKLIAVDKYDAKNNVLIYDSSKYNAETKKWLIPIPTHIGAYRHYRKMLSVSSSRKTGYVTISVDHKSPEVASEFITLIFTEANSLIRERELDKANASLEYLYTQLGSVNQTEVLNSINGLITVQLRKLTLANIKKNYLLDPIDSPFIPETKSSPKRLQMLILGSLLGLVLILLGVTIWHYAFSSTKSSKD